MCAYAEVRRDKAARYACVKDFLTVMDTGQAGRSVPTVGERRHRWEKIFQWKKGACEKRPAFRGRNKGGHTGYGCTVEAMQDVYNHHAFP